MFQALGGSNFSIGKAWESLEQLVAPIPEDEVNEPRRENNLSSPTVEDEEQEGFENAIMQHIISKRQELEKDDARRAPFQHQLDHIPDSPSSMSTITLDEDESPMNNRSINPNVQSGSLPVKNMLANTPVSALRSQSTSSVFLSNAELEKNVQSRYREQLENEIQRFEKRIREQKEMFENILLNVQEERDFYMKKVSILEENGRLDTVVENQQQEILELQEMMRDLSSNLHTALEDRAVLDEKYKVSTKEKEKLQHQIEDLKNILPVHIEENGSNCLSNEEQSQCIEQLTQQLTNTREEIDGLKNTIGILSRENEALVIELSEKDLEITKLQTSVFDTEDFVRRDTAGQNQVQQQLLEESERANDALRSELTALKLEYTTATITWERAKAALDKEIALLKDNSSGTNDQTQEIQYLQQEIHRLETALTESEHILKETEGITWKHKAEAAELLYAYESDQQKWEQQRLFFAEKELLSQQEIQRLQLELQQKQQSPSSESVSSPQTEDIKSVAHISCGPNNQINHNDKQDVEKEKEVLQGQLNQWQELITGIVDILKTTVPHGRISTGTGTKVYNNSDAIHSVSAKLTDLVLTQNLLSSSTLAPFLELLTVLVTTAGQYDKIMQEMNALIDDQSSTRQFIKKMQHQLQDIASFLSLSTLSASLQVDSTELHNTPVLERLAQNLEQLRREIEMKIQVLSSQEKSLQNELLRTKADVAAIQDQQQRHSQTSDDQLQELRTKLASAEDESRKLHQVITQLRSLRRAKDGEEQSAQQEVHHLRTLQQQLLKDNETLKHRLNQLEDIESQYEHLQKQFTETTALTKTLEETLSETKRYLAGKEKQCYDQLTALDVAQAEHRLLQQEMSLRMQEIDNLNDALSHIETVHSAQLQALRRQIQETENMKEAYAKDYAEAQADGFKKSLVEVQKHAQQLTLQLEDQELLHRQHLLQLHQEKQQMQKSLENAVQRLQNSSQDVVDRTLMANLLVQYFQRKKSKEVLSLIARVLNLTDEQLIVVGLKGVSVDIVNTLLTTVIGPTAPVQVEGDNLAELWVNYLINQASADDISGKVKASLHEHSVTNTTSNTSSTSAGNEDPPQPNSSNFHSLPASPAGKNTGERLSTANTADEIRINMTSQTTKNINENFSDYSKCSINHNKDNSETSANNQQLRPEERPLGGFLGAATSILTLGGYWRK